MKIEILPRAEADLIQQFRYYLVEQEAPIAAARFREAVMNSLERLRLHPRVGSLFRGSITDLRSWPVKGFESIRIYYTQNQERLVVVRILHSKRNVRQILGRESFSE